MLFHRSTQSREAMRCQRILSGAKQISDKKSKSKVNAGKVLNLVR